jgi:hypothetical protein
MATTATQTDPRVLAQINEYITAGLERGIKMEISSIGNWCREVTFYEWNNYSMQWRKRMWVSVYTSSSNRLNVEAQWLGGDAGRVNKRDILDQISWIELNDSLQNLVR